MVQLKKEIEHNNDNINDFTGHLFHGSSYRQRNSRIMSQALFRLNQNVTIFISRRRYYADSAMWPNKNPNVMKNAIFIQERSEWVLHLIAEKRTRKLNCFRISTNFPQDASNPLLFFPFCKLSRPQAVNRAICERTHTAHICINGWRQN